MPAYCNAGVQVFFRLWLISWLCSAQASRQEDGSGCPLFVSRVVNPTLHEGYGVQTGAKLVGKLHRSVLNRTSLPPCARGSVRLAPGLVAGAPQACCKEGSPISHQQKHLFHGASATDATLLSPSLPCSVVSAPPTRPLQAQTANRQQQIS
uniref:Secreted protein n=1 Tax=Branchiostoma floridae TaxID=7739 RepID=C3YQ57_BRAFL|eukprot:XP_002601549.1 hypothetical protein BRAFLDRAFT_95785 [Branchiostoma floridae]